LKQITLRSIPDEIEAMVKREAKAKGLSINKAFIALLEKTTGVKTKDKKKKTIYHDLDSLFGVWSKNDAAAFNNSLQLQRKVDEELWKKTR
jgi:CO dehydrogenase/acetyl-CoA synthase alpha subunit